MPVLDTDMVDMVDMDIPIMVNQIHTLYIIILHLQAKAQNKSVTDCCYSVPNIG